MYDYTIIRNSKDDTFSKDEFDKLKNMIIKDYTFKYSDRNSITYIYSTEFNLLLYQLFYFAENGEKKVEEVLIEYARYVNPVRYCDND